MYEQVERKGPDGRDPTEAATVTRATWFHPQLLVAILRLEHGPTETPTGLAAELEDGQTPPLEVRWLYVPPGEDPGWIRRRRSSSGAIEGALDDDLEGSAPHSDEDGSTPPPLNLDGLTADQQSDEGVLDQDLSLPASEPADAESGEQVDGDEEQPTLTFELDQAQSLDLSGQDGTWAEFLSQSAAFAELEEDDPGVASWLATIKLPQGMPGEAITGLIVEGGERLRLLPPSLEDTICTPVEFAQASFARRTQAIRSSALSFLLGAPLAHGIDPDPELSARLAAIRDELREPLPATDIAPGVRCALRLETAYALDDCAFWLSGWVHCTSPHDARFTVVTPEGARIEALPGAVSFHPRPDVNRVFEGDPTPNLGFHAYVELDRPSHTPTGWLVEVRTDAGDVMQDLARTPVVVDELELRRRIMAPLRTESPDPQILANQVLPALKRLHIGGDISVERIADYGTTPKAPEVSIVIPVRHIDRIEHQLVQFAQDPELATAEILYVTPPDASNALRRRGSQLHQLYGVPFRVVELSGGARRPRATNLGAGVARGGLIVVMSGDAFPAKPGWISQLRELLESNPKIAAVAPRLLHHDGSIAHIGASYRGKRDAIGWERALPLRGLSASLSGVAGARRVQALSDACMMISADALRGREGFSELYLDGADEAADLCLRLSADGLEVWVADTDMYHLERAKSWPITPTPISGRFNDWLLDYQHGPQLAAAERRDGAGLTVSEIVELPFPQAGSGRPGKPVEILKVVRSQPDERWLLDAELLRPNPRAELEPYDNTYGFTVEGWAIARDGSPLSIELREGERTLRTLATSMRRDEPLDRHPDAPGADTAGFQGAVGTIGLNQNFTIEVDLVADDGQRSTFATIEGRRRPLRSAFNPSLEPALITTLGRTGSSWFALLLSMHPAIVAYRPFQYEARVASYWMEILHTLAEPTSYIQALRPELYQGHWWIGDQRPSPLPMRLAESQMPRWLGSENVEIIAAFCQSRVDGFYSMLAQLEEQTEPKYFAEKCWPDEVTPQLLSELYPNGREILLVRDFRDMVCSIMGFNAKRGFASFGREVTDSDEEFIRYLRGSAMRMHESWTARRDRALLVRYEDLILSPEATLAEVFSYLEIEADPGTIRHTIDSANAMRPNVQRAHQTSKSVAGSVGRWKHELSPGLLEICHETFGDVLDAFGYDPTQISSSERSATTSTSASGASTASS